MAIASLKNFMQDHNAAIMIVVLSVLGQWQVLGRYWSRSVSLWSRSPQTLTDKVVQAADFVITMGCGDACPIYSGRRYRDWPVADPIGQPLEDVRRIHDGIAARLKAYCHEMDSTLACR